nr:MAG TPA: hypothetical protein [Caudoviricetes sp.]
MATKRICDRCGAEINPPNSVTYAGMARERKVRNENLQKSVGIKRKLLCAYWCCKIRTDGSV